jgi:hypothetical protein
MSTPKWMPRSAITLAAAALGTAGLGISMVPSFAQESKAPASEEPPGQDSDAELKEGGEPATVPGSGSNGPRENGDRIENVAADLTLEAVRIESLNLNDTDQEYAVYRFGRVVHEISDAHGFTLKGFNMDTRATAADARLVQGDPTSVLVGFAPGTDLSRYTLGSVNTGAVEDEAGEANLPGSIPLEGNTVAGTQNQTDGPDLTSVRAIHSLERVVYDYDEQINEQAGSDASRFGYYTADGKTVTGTSIVTADDNSVTVAFDRQTEDGVLFWAKSGAVKNLRDIASSPGSIGTATTAPDLVSVSNVIGQSQFDYTFDAPVSSVALDKFMVYSADGTAYKATGYARPSAEVVRIAIPEIHKFSADMALAAADEGAVTTSDRSEVASTLGSRHIGSTSAADGLSAGPYLTSVSMDDAVGQVLFVFDKPVDDNRTYDAKNFMIMTPAGDLVRAQSMVEATGNTILMNFDKNIVRAANGVVVNDDAVQDFQGQKNPARTIKI